VRRELERMSIFEGRRYPMKSHTWVQLDQARERGRWHVHLVGIVIIALLLLDASSPADAQGWTPNPSRRATLDCEGEPATIVGTHGADTIAGTAGDDVIVGRGGDDVIHGLAGNDLICGGPEDDHLHGGPGSDGIDGEGGNDVLRGGAGHDGGESGGPGHDELYGEKGGNNDLTPGPGDDLVVGSGTGADWVHMEEATGPIHANLMTGIATGQGTDTLVDVSSVLSGPYDDTLIGGDGNDDLVGRAGDDTLIGHGGNDVFRGQQGNDVYRGGPGFDLAEYYDQAAADGLEIGPMNVNLRTGVATGDGTDTLTSIESATGSDKADTMIGDRKGNLFKWLFGGDDTVRAGGGNDFVAPGVGANTVAGGSGRDLVSFVGGKDPGDDHPALTVDLEAGTSSAGDVLSGVEDVLGSPEGDTLIGDDGSNSLYGYLGNDVLSGGAGDDRLVGGRGDDDADGGTGADHCRAETQANCEAAARVARSPLMAYVDRLSGSRLFGRIPVA
jgi:Ca2+-binding RTX toxin-like protein